MAERLITVSIPEGVSDREAPSPAEILSAEKFGITPEDMRDIMEVHSESLLVSVFSRN